MSILSLHDVSLNLAGKQILDHASWQIQPRDRIALVGRNGAGKSTLIKLLEGKILPDQGVVQKLGGLRISGLTQEVPIEQNESVYHFLVKDLGEIGELLAGYHMASLEGDLKRISFFQQRIDEQQAWERLPQVENMASRLGLDMNASMNHLSGGMKRRALLAASLIAAPDLLLLDEPTNHLDIPTIEWLESYLKNYSGSLLVVTHDREFLAQVANQIVEIDRGQIYRYECDYETYLERREARLLSEDKKNALFDKNLAQEEAWIRTGIKARRTRNEGRVRALKALREEFKQRRLQVGKIKSIPLEVVRSGNLVLEAQNLNYSLQGKALLNDFSLLLTRGDKIGIVGPNGCGKTTLVRLLLGELKADSGELRYGTSLAVAYFDQLRRHLDEEKTVLANVGDGADYVTINGKQKHVATYLREFLFPPESFNQLVSTLSGGERNRLLLAKLFAKPVNLLVMDEPTNDLDMETLELLESMLIDYPGTLLLISHDRAFLNNVVTSLLVFEGNGHFKEYMGGYDDYQQQRKEKRASPPAVAPSAQRRNADKLSYNEQRELSQLPQKIETLEAKIAALQENMAAPAFYQQDGDAISQSNQQLAAFETELSQLYGRWEFLESKK
ncbi:ATP-binding cassette domain-containing protein [Legionella septentrionalis]|uniref:ATP-binding cassette domain-containing protein n=1 Tax=Legionella septentrionalis TaxID=2498109 RepID=UPI000F8EC441|nr:ATP-binding cassette domain-containing protein [Legionella septentrionalis]RUQ99970.1 ATP-binding cassette domain-containing protein [Legionella septentrionalis]